MAWQTPKTDWAINPKNPKSEDFNRIEGNISALKEEIETKKGLIVDAVNSMGQAAALNDTHLDLATKIKQISNDATANENDVLSGTTFYQGGAKKTGTMLNRGTINQTITTQNGSYTIPSGFHSGTGKVTASLANLIASNIKAGVNIGGIVGTLVDGSSMKRWATGLGTNAINVNNLLFTPSIVVAFSTSPTTSYPGFLFVAVKGVSQPQIYEYSSLRTIYAGGIWTTQSGGEISRWTNTYPSMGMFYIQSNGFLLSESNYLPKSGNRWYAFE